MTRLVYVDLPYACFGLVVDQSSGKVVEAAPIAKWTVGRYWADVHSYYLTKKGLTRWVWA